MTIYAVLFSGFLIYREATGGLLGTDVRVFS